MATLIDGQLRSAERKDLGSRDTIFYMPCLNTRDTIRLSKTNYFQNSTIQGTWTEMKDIQLMLLCVSYILKGHMVRYLEKLEHLVVQIHTWIQATEIFVHTVNFWQDSLHHVKEDHSMNVNITFFCHIFYFCKCYESLPIIHFNSCFLPLELTPSLLFTGYTNNKSFQIKTNMGKSGWGHLLGGKSINYLQIPFSW